MESGIFILLGSNLGDRHAHLATARHAVRDLPGEIKNQSPLYRTAAWGKTDQEDFYNQALEIETDLSPHALLTELLRIEMVMGRTRVERWGQRIIDIDLLFYKDMVLDTKDLVIPHPRIPERRFVLTPLNDIAPSWVHPILKKTINKLLEACTDPLEVTKIL